MPIWYEKYDELSARISQVREEYLVKCQSLSIHPTQALSEFSRDLVSRIVHESNWQEGLCLDQDRTRELVDAVFDDPGMVRGPHLDFQGLLSVHRTQVLRMKRQGVSNEELAALNLSRAHRCIQWIAHELSSRQTATLIQALKESEPLLRKYADRIPPESAAPIEAGMRTICALQADQCPAYGPLTDNIATTGELYKHLINVDFEELLHPFRLDYIHFLHRLTMMGILPPRKCGILRKVPVSVGDPDILFPPPAAIPPLMEEYCKHFPTILPSTVKYDPILTAAKASYDFVRIHPYTDGNGRVSRLLMNMILWSHHPPVCLKADKKGRHKYHTAIRRANRGNLRPLGCLISEAIIDNYTRMVAALTPPH